ncbi:MAG: hypothetical protein JW774_04525 [Candidatus Aureabacteria bacterium]|nr:hypothetical protein [Candidatus Auribacterota bacterium]
MKIIIGYPLDLYPEFSAGLKKLSQHHRVLLKDYSYSWLLNQIKDTDVLVPSIKTIVDDAVLKRANRLQLIATPTTGVDHIRISEKPDGLRIISLNDFKKQIQPVSSTAELGFALMLGLSRKIPSSAHDVVLNGRWDRNRYLGHELRGKVLGIAGMGRIGQKIAAYGKAFGMEIIYWDKNRAGKWKRVSSFRALLNQSDYIVLSISYDQSTHHLLNGDNIRSIKKKAFLINISRGKVVDEKWLCHALQAGILAGAGTDVLEYELEDVLASPLLQYARKNKNANILITPHIGGATLEAWKQVFALIFDFILKREVAS